MRSIHNEKLGNLESPCFGKFVKNYPKVFHDVNKRPAVSLLDCVFNWTAFYAPQLRRLAGFTNTEHDEYIVRGWKIFKNTNGEPEIRWKVDPAIDKEWRGRDGLPNTDGFFIMKGHPVGSPEPIQPKTEDLVRPAYLNQMTSRKMTKIMAAHGAVDAVDYNYTAAMTGVVPVVNHLEANAPEGAWGPLVEVGSSPERLGKVRLITRVWTNDADIWELPVGSNDERVAATSNVFHFSNLENFWI